MKALNPSLICVCIQPVSEFGLGFGKVSAMVDGACPRIASPFLASPDRPLSLSQRFSFYRSEISLSPLSTLGPRRGGAAKAVGRTHRQLCEILLLKGPTTPRVAFRFGSDGWILEEICFTFRAYHLLISYHTNE